VKKDLHFKIVFLISALALLINVGSYGVIESSDARYAEIGREMVTSGDYLHPNLLDVHHYHKPPLTYQITALGYELFGINPFGARFFLQITILIQLLLVYALAKLLFNNEKTALWASLIYISFHLVLISSRNLTTDAFLNTFALASIYAWVRYRKNASVGWLYVFTISLALGFLTKGPVIFIIPVVFILFFNSTEKSITSLSIHHIFSWLLFLLIAASWFVYLATQNPDFIDYFLGRQTVDRFSKNAFGRTEPFWYFFAYNTLIDIPWTLILAYLIIKQKQLFTAKSIYFALLASCVIPLIFFSISSSKRILYVLPMYGLLALLIAQLLATLPSKNIRFINYLIIGFSSLVIIAFIVTLGVDVTFHFPKALGIISILLIPIIVWIYKTKNIDAKSKPIYTSFIISLFLLIGSSSVFSANQLKVNSNKPITDFLIANGLNQRAVMVYNSRKPSIAFGLNKSIISLNDGHPSLARETQFETDNRWKNYLIDVTDETELKYLQSVASKPSVLLLYKRPLPERLTWLLPQYKHKKVMGKWTIYY
jgi:4-amino-4-deoxy-L-arabinose transferase